MFDAADKAVFKAESIPDELFAEPTTEELLNLHDEEPGFAVSIPLDKVAVGNLTNLLEAKARKSFVLQHTAAFPQTLMHSLKNAMQKPSMKRY